MGLARMLSYYMDEDYPEGPEIQLLLSEWREFELPTLETDVYIWHYTLLVVHDRNEWINDHS